MSCKRICAMTMVRNDNFFLSRWVRYYGALLGKENLFVCFDGEDQTLPDDCQGVNVVVRRHVDMDVASGDHDRASFMSDQAAARFAEGYERVIGGDVDEFLVVDPSLGKTLPELLSENFRGTSLSGLGVDVAQNMIFEKELDKGRLFLEQREYAQLYPRYTKAVVMLKPARWGSGYHRIKGHDFRIVPGLYLFHFGCVDLEMLRSRSGDSARAQAGWSRHLKKRARTIGIVSHYSPCNWDKVVGYVRWFQQLARPIFAWNKPTMFGKRIVVRIPERFRNLV